MPRVIACGIWHPTISHKTLLLVSVKVPISIQLPCTQHGTWIEIRTFLGSLHPRWRIFSSGKFIWQSLWNVIWQMIKYRDFLYCLVRLQLKVACQRCEYFLSDLLSPCKVCQVEQQTSVIRRQSSLYSVPTCMYNCYNEFVLYLLT